jgi:hypothetical protein
LAGHVACSFAPYAVYFLYETNQIQKVFDPKKGASSRNNDKWIFRPDVRPMQRYGRSAPFGVIKENTTPTCDSSYAFDFKFDISIGMEGMDDSEAFVVKVLMGRS